MKRKIEDYKKELELSYRAFMSETIDKKLKRHYYIKAVYCFKKLDESNKMTFSEYLEKFNLKISIRDRNRERFIELLNNYVETGNKNTYRTLHYCFKKCKFNSNKKLIDYIRKRRKEIKGDEKNVN